jgi:hypothetical protein
MEDHMAVNQGDIIQAVAAMEWDGVEDVLNIYQFQLQSPASVTEAGVISDLTDFLDSAYDVLKLFLTTLLTFKEIRLLNKTQDVILGTFPWPTLVAGTGATDTQAPGVCALINFTTTKPRVSPRKYLGVFTEGALGANGAFGPSVVAALAIFAGLFIGDIVQPNGTYLYGYDSPKTLQFETPNGVSTGSVPAYQRRRKQGRGS